MFWDVCKADQIKNQAVAEYIVQWLWASGPANAFPWIHGVLKKYFNYAMPANTYVISNETVSRINSVNQSKLFDALHKENVIYLKGVVSNSPAKAKYLTGWLRRATEFYTGGQVYLAGTGGGVVGGLLALFFWAI